MHHNCLAEEVGKEDTCPVPKAAQVSTGMFLHCVRNNFLWWNSVLLKTNQEKNLQSSVSTQVPANRETSELTEGDRRVKLGWEGKANKQRNQLMQTGCQQRKPRREKPQLSFAGYLQWTASLLASTQPQARILSHHVLMTLFRDGRGMFIQVSVR